MGIEIIQVPVGHMQNFSYIIYDTSTRESIIIDPSWDLHKLESLIEDHSLHVKYIINTHHHLDHTTGNEQMAKSTGAPIVQHEYSELPHDMSLKDGDIIHFGESSIKVLYTPGHSKDSMCLIGPDFIFSGDTLFVGSCGRVDLPGGSSQDLYHSIFDVLSKLDDHLKMYPGHDYGPTPTSTIGEQKQYNPVMYPTSKEEFVARMG